MYRQAEFLEDFVGKALHFFRLDSLHSAHAQRVSDDDLRDLVLPDHARKLFEIQPLVLPANGWEALGGDTQRVRDGQTDGLGAYIQPQHSWPEFGRFAAGVHSRIICLACPQTWLEGENTVSNGQPQVARPAVR